MPGDLDDFDENEERLLLPQWDDDLQCYDVFWGEDNTHGGGEPDAEKDDKDRWPWRHLRAYRGQLGWPLVAANFTGAYDS